MSRSGPVSIDLIAVNGRVINSASYNFLNTGEQNITFFEKKSSRNITGSSMALMRLQTPSGTVVKKLFLVVQ